MSYVPSIKDISDQILSKLLSDYLDLNKEINLKNKFNCVDTEFNYTV